MPIQQSSKERIEALTATLFFETAANGVYGRSGLFEHVIEGLTALITRQRLAGTEVVRFPPVMSRDVLEKSGYLKSFPHLLGCVSCLSGEEADVRALVEGRNGTQDWAKSLEAVNLALTPAACYPVYPLVASRGAVSAAGVLFDVESYCFRREVSHEAGRLQSFRMREYVCVGSPATALQFRESWRARGERLANELALPFRVAPASDPFFGRVGKMMAVSQVQQALKFELLIPVHSEDEPTACMSFNYHQDHFGTNWGMNTDAGEVAHTACAAFGIERLGIALFATHGLDLQAWPAGVRTALSL
ncbi:MAG: amino acid--[acyl-carrier-protein] ligase [Gemmatimonadales bacterium]